VLQIDIDWICAHGVELETGVDIGRDKTIEDLLAEGFEAVLIATGLPGSRMLPMPGADHPRVLGAMDFLYRLAFDGAVDVGGDVLTIGGGNVACDAARSAVRLGAERVRMMCLENAEEMPAWDWEVREAEEEGVTIVHRRGPVEVVTEGGAIRGLKTRGVTRVFDDEGRFHPQYDESDIETLACDTVIVAIGQQADYGFVEGTALERSERGRLVFNPATHQTSRENVFACGEIVTPPGSAVEACASGQRAAEAIDQYLSGETIDVEEEIPPAIEEIATPTKEKVIRVDRADVPTEPADKRRASFGPVDRNFDIETALREARRCMSCGSGAEVLADKCAACLTCLRVCPFDVPVVTDVARMRSTLCQACGICAAACPAGAIVNKGRGLHDIESLIAERMKRVEPGEEKTVAFVSGHRAGVDVWRGETVAGVPGLVRVVLPSIARLSEQDVLRAFELGAERVIVVAAAPEAERYPEATRRAKLRVDRARELTSEAGYPPESVHWIEIDEPDFARLDELLKEAVG
jgi:thioredoxin reductase/ferredoxin/coenzyme F420-reducing hydrogenase delta subunit